MSGIKITRPEFLYEVKDVMKEHGLTATQTFQVLSLLHGIEWEIPATDLIILVNKRLVKAGNKVNVDVLFRRDKSKQLIIDLTFNSDPVGTEETLKLAANLLKELVDPEQLKETNLKTIANEYFAGDVTKAKYFTIFRAMFPIKNLKENKRWNKHFKITYEGSSRWSSSYIVPKKFDKIFKERDIGLFLTGLYYAVVDSIDYNTHMCFITKPEKFLNDYTQWYDLAKSKLETIKRKKENSEKTL